MDANWLCYSYLSWSTGQHLRQNKRGALPTAAPAVGFASDLELVDLCSFAAGLGASLSCSCLISPLLDRA